MSESFHQQPKESAKAFAAFSFYLGLGEQRSLEAVATDKTEVTGADGGAIRIELEAALKKVYGQAELGSNVVDVQAVPMLEGK